MVVADSLAEVYKAPEVANLPEYVGYWGCVYGRHQAYLLGSPPEGGSPSGVTGIERLTLAGTMVAYYAFHAGEHEARGGAYNEVVVRDLRSDRVVHRGRSGAEAIVLKSDGSVAWINGEGITNVEWKIHVFDEAGERVVAAGFDIDPHSLKLTRSTIYWMQGGKLMSAVLH